MTSKREGNGYFYCKYCKTKMDSVLTPDENGGCVYCGYNKYQNIIYKGSLPHRILDYSMFGNCKKCNDRKELLIGKRIHCLKCQKFKGNYYG